MNRRAALVVMGLLIGCAHAPAPQPAAPAASLTSRIPGEIGTFKLTERIGVRDFPNDSLFRFRDSSRTNLSVIIYDIPDDVKVGPDSQAWTVRESGKFRAVQEIFKSRGQIAAYTVAVTDTTRFAADGRTILEYGLVMPVRYPNGAVAVEMQYLYLIGSKFVKVRGTIPAQEWQHTGVPSFAREVAARLARGS